MKAVAYYILAASGLFLTCIDNVLIGTIGLLIAGFGMYKFGCAIGFK